MNAAKTTREPLELTALSLPEELHRQLKAEAKQHGMSMAALVRELLTLGLAQTEEASR